MIEQYIQELQAALQAERELADQLYHLLISQQSYILSTGDSEIARVLHAYRQARSINIIP